MFSVLFGAVLGLRILGFRILGFWGPRVWGLWGLRTLRNLAVRYESAGFFPAVLSPSGIARMV